MARFFSRRSAGSLDEFELTGSAAIDDRAYWNVTWTHSLDGSRWAAAYEIEGKWSRLMVDGNFLPQDFDWLRLNAGAIPNKLTTGNDAFFSPGGRHYACPVMLGDASCILFDGELIPCAVNDMEVRNIFWNPDGERYNYLVLKKCSFARDENCRVVGDVCMVLDGKVGPAFWEIDGGLYYSPDGLHTAYVGMAMTGEKEAHDHMMVDGVSIHQCGYINHHDTVGFTADNKVYFFSATAEDINDSIDCDYFFHYGESAIGPHYLFFDCLVSPDNCHIAIFSQRERHKRRQQDILILDGKRCSTAATGWSNHSFSPDSQHHLWEVERKDQEWLLLDGKTLFGLSQCNWGARFTSDSRYIEYVCRQGRTLRYRKLSVAKLLKRRRRNGRGDPGRR